MRTSGLRANLLETTVLHIGFTLRSPMPTSPHALRSLDAWPGETARPPLRLLDGRQVRPGAQPPAAARPAERMGWLQRMRRALAGG
jgi:hypothetical protein